MGKRGNLPPGPVGSVHEDKWLVSLNPHGTVPSRAQPPRAPCLLHASSVLPGLFGDLAGRCGEMAPRLSKHVIDEQSDSSGCDVHWRTVQVNEVPR
jgi:hypothetical protein